jgi:hypothetical protein
MSIEKTIMEIKVEWNVYFVCYRRRRLRRHLNFFWSRLLEGKQHEQEKKCSKKWRTEVLQTVKGTSFPVKKKINSETRFPYSATVNEELEHKFQYIWMRGNCFIIDAVRILSILQNNSDLMFATDQKTEKIGRSPRCKFTTK